MTIKKVFSPLGATSHSETEREINDYYATEPKAIEVLLKHETFNKYIWECACGEGHISKVLESNGYIVTSTDLIYRGYGEGGCDFLAKRDIWAGDIITNPPYKYATEFVIQAMDNIMTGNKVAMLLKLTFLESKKRRKLFEKYPPKTIYVFSERVECAKNGNFSKANRSAIAYAWFVWEKGFNGKPTIEWV